MTIIYLYRLCDYAGTRTEEETTGRSDPLETRTKEESHARRREEEAHRDGAASLEEQEAHGRTS